MGKQLFWVLPLVAAGVLILCILGWVFLSKCKEPAGWASVLVTGWTALVIVWYTI